MSENTILFLNISTICVSLCAIWLSYKTRRIIKETDRRIKELSSK